MMKKEELQQLSPAELIDLVLDLQQTNEQLLSGQELPALSSLPSNGEQMERFSAPVAGEAVGRPQDEIPPSHDPEGGKNLDHHLDQRNLNEQLRRTSLLLQLSIEFRETLDSAVIVERMLHVMVSNLGISNASVVLLGGNGAIDLAMSLSEGKVQQLTTVMTRSILDRGLAGWALRNGRSVVLPDVSRDKRWIPYAEWQSTGSAIVLPIRQAQTTLGVLTVYHPTPNHFTSRDMLLMEGVAAQAGVALNSSRRYHEESLRREQALVLFSMSQYLTAERTYEDLAAMLQEKSTSVFGVDFGLLFLSQESMKLSPVSLPPALNQPNNRLILKQATVAARNAWDRKNIFTDADSPEHPTRTFVAMPLIHRGTASGVIVLVSTSGSEINFSPNIWSMITTFTNVIAATCANMKLVEQLRRQTETLETIVAERTRMVQQSSDLLRVVFDSLPEGLVLLDPQEVILESNQAFNHTIVGSPHQMVVGKDVSEIWEDLEQRGEMIIEMKKPSGTPPGAGEENRVMRLFFPDATGQHRWFEINRLAVRDAQEEIVYYLERWLDITLQEKLQRQLMLQGQQNILGQMAARVVHDMSSPIHQIGENLDACTVEVEKSDEMQHYLTRTREELSLLESTLKSFLHLYHMPDTRWECLDILQLLRKVQQFAAQHFEKQQIRVHLEADENLRPLYGQPDVLRQVFLGIVFNAQESMPDGGDITIGCRWNNGEIDTGEGPYPSCTITFLDTSGGMRAEQLAQVFEPFASTRPYGSGMGLYLGKQIIEQHEGRIEVSSMEGAGTLVTITLPWNERCGDGDA
jgi:PAS domain S-box-containing protein